MPSAANRRCNSFEGTKPNQSRERGSRARFAAKSPRSASRTGRKLTSATGGCYPASDHVSCGSRNPAGRAGGGRFSSLAMGLAGGVRVAPGLLADAPATVRETLSAAPFADLRAAALAPQPQTKRVSPRGGGAKAGDLAGRVRSRLGAARGGLLSP